MNMESQKQDTVNSNEYRVTTDSSIIEAKFALSRVFNKSSLNRLEEVEGLAAARKASLSGSEPSDSTRGAFALCCVVKRSVPTHKTSELQGVRNQGQIIASS